LIDLTAPDKPMISSCQVGENYVNISWSPYVDKSVNPGSEFFVEYQKDGWSIFVLYFYKPHKI